MLAVALEYRKSINAITTSKPMRRFELGKMDWEILEDLWYALKVRVEILHIISDN